MKVLCTIVFSLLSSIVWSQMQLYPDSSYVNDGALVLRFKLVNESDQTIVFKMDTRKSLQQLNKQKMREELVSASFQNFIVFYNKKKLIDEVVLPCDFQQSQNAMISLTKGEEQVLIFQTHCLSETVLTQLNNGHLLRYEMYIKYEETETIHTLKTERVKLKVRKPSF